MLLEAERGQEGLHLSVPGGAHARTGFRALVAPARGRESATPANSAKRQEARRWVGCTAVCGEYDSDISTLEYAALRAAHTWPLYTVKRQLNSVC